MHVEGIVGGQREVRGKREGVNACGTVAEVGRPRRRPSKSNPRRTEIGSPKSKAKVRFGEVRAGVLAPKPAMVSYRL